MSRISQINRSVLGRHTVDTATYRGSEGTAWFAGLEMRASSIAALFCGDDVGPGSGGRIRLRRVPDRITEVAAGGGLAILRIRQPDQRLADILPHAVAVPALVDVHTDLPADRDTLRTRLLTSTTREDFRRIRRAGFSSRVTRDPGAVSEFHARHYAPLVARQFPEDGRVRPLGRMLDELDRGGELVCADIDGTWVAGMFNVVHESTYALMTLGIRDADDAVRRKRVAAALIVRSLERAVELGRERATLGRSLPFLGKGPVWFKAKWGGTVTRKPGTHDIHMFMDLRHAAVRRMLSASPVIHHEGDALVVSRWLEPGTRALQGAETDPRRFPGISRWYVLGEPETLVAGAEALSAGEGIVPVPVTPHGDHPLWLGEVLPGPTVSM